MILIVGTPGAGKTTQSSLLAQYLGCQWFSMGELIRKNATGSSRRDMQAGKIISDEVTMDIVDKTLSSIDTTREECVFEGNPRSVAQAQWWLDQAQAGRFHLKGVIHMVASIEVANHRLLERRRLDDLDEHVIKTRFAEYHRSIRPTLNYFVEKGVPVHEINANGSIEEVAKQIRLALGV